MASDTQYDKVAVRLCRTVVYIHLKVYRCIMKPWYILGWLRCQCYCIKWYKTSWTKTQDYQEAVELKDQTSRHCGAWLWSCESLYGAVSISLHVAHVLGNCLYLWYVAGQAMSLVQGITQSKIVWKCAKRKIPGTVIQKSWCFHRISPNVIYMYAQGHPFLCFTEFFIYYLYGWGCLLHFRLHLLNHFTLIYAWRLFLDIIWELRCGSKCTPLWFIR